jgi:hypothetical protein
MLPVLVTAVDPSALPTTGIFICTSFDCHVWRDGSIPKLCYSALNQRQNTTCTKPSSNLTCSPQFPPHPEPGLQRPAFLGLVSHTHTTTQGSRDLVPTAALHNPAAQASSWSQRWRTAARSPLLAARPAAPGGSTAGAWAGSGVCGLATMAVAPTPAGM